MKKLELMEALVRYKFTMYRDLTWVTKDTGRAAERIDTATRSDNISIFLTRYK